MSHGKSVSINRTREALPDEEGARGGKDVKRNDEKKKCFIRRVNCFFFGGDEFAMEREGSERENLFVSDQSETTEKFSLFFKKRKKNEEEFIL